MPRMWHGRSGDSHGELSTIYRYSDARRVRLRLVAIVLLTALALSVGCAPDEDPEAPERRTGETTQEATAPAGLAALEDVDLQLEPFVEDLDAPLFITHAGDESDRLFVVEQGGRIIVVKDGEPLGRPYLDFSDRVSSGGERGLLGLAFSPDFAQSGRFYVNYTDTSGDTVVARVTAEDPASDAPKLSAPQTILKVDQPYANHNGGCIMFGPDGYLYIGMGDGGSGGDPQGNAQDRDRLLGKMLRIDVEPPVEGGEKPYRIPEDNPYADGGGDPEIWMLGLRNPWRYSFDRETEAMWIGDVGQNSMEEINYAAPGEGGQNWGWNLFEGTEEFRAGSGSADELRRPVIVYTRDEGQSVTGGYVYRGDDYPQLEGLYLYADFSAGWIAGMRADDPSLDSPTRVLVEDAGNPASFGQDAAGELYVVDLGGTVSKVTAR